MIVIQVAYLNGKEIFKHYKSKLLADKFINILHNTNDWCFYNIYVNNKRQ